MFEQATLSTGPRAKRVWTTLLGVTGQAMVVTFLILIPMIWPDVLPAAKAYITVVGPHVGYKPPQPPPGTTSVQPRGPRRNGPLWRPPTQPIFVPKGVPDIIDDGPSFPFAGPTGSTIGVPSSIGDGPDVVGGVGIMAVLPPPPRLPDVVVKPVEPVTKRIIQTSQLDQAQILHRVDPVYPELGKRMRVSGTVELRGIIGTDGRIRSLQVLSGHPLLVKAAVDAVSQWIYKPTRLSGQPVEVDAPISVVFRLN